MSNNIVLTFTLLYGSAIALICAVYVYIMHRRNIINQVKQEDNNQ
jgi:hypothetical protein